MVKPLVSILIPAYNAGEWIADTLRSAIAQTWERKEIIVVDDGSTDQTLAIARQFECDWIKVFTHKNCGAASTRNKAFSLCTGNYVQWLDADDLLSPDKISLQMRVAQECEGKRTLFSSGWGEFLYRYDRAEFIQTPLWDDLTKTEWLARKMGLNHHMQTATWLVTRELTEAAGPWDTRLLGDDDGEYFCRVLLASDGVRFVPGARVYYRASGSGSLSYVAGSDRKLEAQLCSMKLHIGYLRSLEDSERTRKASVQYLQNWLVNFYPERLDLVQEMQGMAAELGGRLEIPRFSWKYQWINALAGPVFAKRAQIRLRELKSSLVRSWDRTLFRYGNKSFPVSTQQT